MTRALTQAELAALMKAGDAPMRKITEVDRRVGTLDQLQTHDKGTIVEAINELHTSLVALSETVDGLGGGLP